MIEVDYARGLAAKLRNGRMIEPSRTIHIEGIGDVGTGEIREMSHPDAIAAADTIDRLILMIQQAEDAMRERAGDMLRKAIENGYSTPARKVDQCEHGKFGWEDCIACYDEQLLKTEAAIRGIDAGGEGE